MRIDVSFKNMKSSDYLENIIAKDVEKVKKKTKMFKNEEVVHLSLHLERNPHREEYLAWATLYLPKKVLKSQSSSDSLPSAINKTFLGLLRQVDKYKILIERHLQKRRSKLDKR